MTKDEKIAEVLAVLDLPEEEQRQWLYNYFVKKYYKTSDWPEWYGYCDVLAHVPSRRRAILADLAFKMRDEVKHLFIRRNLWWAGLERVYLYIEKIDFDGFEFRKWFIEDAQPIHWILATIIARILSEGQNERLKSD